jgi:hypothetical protein
MLAREIAHALCEPSSVRHGLVEQPPARRDAGGTPPVADVSQRRVHVAGHIGPCQVRGPLAEESGVFELRLGSAWVRGSEVRPSDKVNVTLWPEGPQRDELEPDVVAALEAAPKAGAFFDGLAQFYRNAYLRWIDATKRGGRHPDGRHVPFAEACDGRERRRAVTSTRVLGYIPNMRFGHSCIVLLAACDGGGGGTVSPPTPPPNVQITHPFLVGSWAGTARSTQGPVINLFAQITNPGGAIDRFPLDITISGSPCFSSASGTIKPRDASVEVELGVIRFQGTIVGQERIEGVYQVVGAQGACSGDIGEVTLLKVAMPTSPVLIGVETYDTPELWLRVVTVAR